MEQTGNPSLDAERPAAVSGALVRQVIKAAERVTKRRFCSHHQGEVDSDKGSIAQKNKSKRWMCFFCQAKSLARENQIRLAAGRELLPANAELLPYMETPTKAKEQATI